MRGSFQIFLIWRRDTVLGRISNIFNFFCRTNGFLQKESTKSMSVTPMDFQINYIKTNSETREFFNRVDVYLCIHT